ncbi:MAG: hypothetical protein IPO80_11575 [Propionibacteriaceae bacterium]|nr:hypothetical protein [Propionibacteriaceae bacterium]
MAGRLGFDDPILWVNDPVGATTLKVTGWAGLYDITDDWLEAERTPAEHARLVRDEDAFLCAPVLVVVVCSPGLVATQSPGLSAHTLVRNAVDVEEYRVRRPRPDLPEGPVAPYLRARFTDRIDVGCAWTPPRLCEDGEPRAGQARAAGGWSGAAEGGGGVVVGPGPKDRRRCCVPCCSTPMFCRPHVVTSFTDSLDPIKLYEYQAVGRPVVSTPVAGFRDSGDPR